MTALSPTLSALREKASKATPGPWCYEQVGEKCDVCVVGVVFHPDDKNCERPVSGRLRPYDKDGKEIDYYRTTICALDEAEHSTGESSPTYDAAFIAAASPDVVMALVEAAESARQIGPELQRMYDGQDKERRETGSVGSYHRDRFESIVDALDERLAHLEQVMKVGSDG